MKWWLIAGVYGFIPTVWSFQPASISGKNSPGLTKMSAASQVNQPLLFRVADKVVSTMFGVEPVFNFLSEKARDTMIKRAEKIGVSWPAMVEEYQTNLEELTKDYEKVLVRDLQMPDYYLKPFHAYKEGNLGWLPAMEVEAAAYSVHSPIYTTKELEKEGDAKLRGYFHERMMDMLKASGFKPRQILDVGCSTGLSTLRLHQTFPEAEVVGLDLSPYMVAVARYNLRKRPELRQASERIEYMQGLGEATGMASGSMDMVSVCLVHHELPNAAAVEFLREAHRVLRPGGVLSFMDMDPTSQGFQRMTRNPLLFALFKSTEPWLQEYATLDLLYELKQAGFKDIQVQSNSPRHRTIVAFAG